MFTTVLAIPKANTCTNFDVYNLKISQVETGKTMKTLKLYNSQQNWQGPFNVIKH